MSSYSTSCFYSFSCLSYGDVTYGTYTKCLVNYTIVGTAYTIIGTANGSTLPLVIFHALALVLSYSLFTLELEALLSSTLFFFLRALINEFIATFFLFSSVVYISSLVLFTLATGFCGFSFWCTNRYWKTFANIKVDWHASFLSPLFSLTYLYH